MRNGLKCLGAAVVVLSLCGAAALFAADPGSGDQDNKWRTKDKNGNNAPIEMEITAPTDDDKTGNPAAHYLPINHTLTLFALAWDVDSYCKPTNKPGGDGKWYNYVDDVMSGDTPTDHHMWWEVAAGDGEFVYEPGPPVVNHKYGYRGTYTAPDHQPGSNLRTVTVRAKANDFQRNGDTRGANDSTALSDAFEIKVWQVTLSKIQTKGVTTSDNYSGVPLPIDVGGKYLGWVIPGDPAGSTSYTGNTELKGEIPLGPDVTAGYQWKNERKGIKRYKVNGGDWEDPPVFYSEGYTGDFSHTYLHADSDVFDPNGNDVREIFALDAPGVPGGAANNIAIGPPDNRTDYNFAMHYRAEVGLNGTPISDQLKWSVNFTLDVVNQHWHVVNHSP